MLSMLALSNKCARNKHFIGILILACVALVSFAILQDFLHSKRNGYSFYFSESLLFKTLWFFFPPILILLKSYLDKYSAINKVQLFKATSLSILAHLCVVPVSIWFLSMVFRSESYSVVKVVSFTLSNDLLKLILIYGAFALLYKQLFTIKLSEQITQNDHSKSYLIVKSATDTDKIFLNNIYFIEAATPYVSIQADGKKYLQSASLKTISNKLDERFIRVHKSFIVNIDKVISYQSRMNGDYDLKLASGITIRLSRHFAKNFKLRFMQTPRLN